MIMLDEFGRKVGRKKEQKKMCEREINARNCEKFGSTDKIKNHYHPCNDKNKTTRDEKPMNVTQQCNKKLVVIKKRQEAKNSTLDRWGVGASQI